MVGPDFEIIRQLTRQMGDVNRAAMVGHGWTREIDTLLYELVRSIPREVARVRIVAGDRKADRAEVPEQALRADGEVVRYVRRPVLELWPVLLAATWELLGGKEARYRTGYDADEITAALASVTEAVREALRGSG
ncbi:hypothetical protein AW168_06425 [Nocardia brasiliensis]|uniref:Uncharacterized protein n=2 Tax=Nocardia brasiliensis TaxID=37326 RepID=K0F3H8_NOCB7|nr:hypothetical protein O3I_031540 [Nocardia brasiliensis ATCC 700358]OCF91405.1 hypothetical protein AW168_06425 [Nocardia brasiliensis]